MYTSPQHLLPEKVNTEYLLKDKTGKCSGGVRYVERSIHGVLPRRQCSPMYPSVVVVSNNRISGA
jgi:hypothetical protein